MTFHGHQLPRILYDSQPCLQLEGQEQCDVGKSYVSQLQALPLKIACVRHCIGVPEVHAYVWTFTTRIPRGEL